MSLIGPIISVEDDIDDQYLIREVIQSLAIPNQLVFFSNGQDALNYLEITSEQPFLILCDINMPIMNGIELRQRINGSDYLRRKAIPFVFLTTAANKALVNMAYDATVQGFYQKSANYTGFYQQIKLIIDYWQTCLHPNSQLT
ncbi:response regulator [Spirosoma sp. HMF4905]|uniref:Response regulator n=1 Tax=Spirosoma arboris TaxID=2682092 RepID=A0A7K1SLK4_9BACT|nr:response regulator [Spirosoma arboris]MVM34690.1 response regulator [Spirosoma arboris]